MENKTKPHPDDPGGVELPTRTPRNSIVGNFAPDLEERRRAAWTDPHSRYEDLSISSESVKTEDVPQVPAYHHASRGHGDDKG